MQENSASEYLGIISVETLVKDAKKYEKEEIERENVNDPDPMDYDSRFDHIHRVHMYFNSQAARFQTVFNYFLIIWYFPR